MTYVCSTVHHENLPKTDKQDKVKNLRFSQKGRGVYDTYVSSVEVKTNCKLKSIYNPSQVYA